ncbi:unnamed protein product [Penicillium salamii]|uniref:Rhodopsin domain-containing protein n=1 Tax=Penicillium salamii TaxID=1612424 RepID=A0A9W4JLV3_9EURO|nr:unnamed protein product [Penicillium salamii]CAG8063022.1 unnamed protein product [Penicillium salamii]CAG8148683.1 unnamed protein product [Penicillium salamii]CAG8169617.1 unnamed protein product [Penicillium salamii]CAG8229427.1 unnamed protein product [Penicillium salamii]
MGTRFTGDSKDPEVNVTAWCLLVVVILAVFARLGTKYHIFHRLTSDDFLVVLSSVFCIAQVVILSLAVASGYGTHKQNVSDSDFEQVMKVCFSLTDILLHQAEKYLQNLWAASLLYIASLCFSKLSMVLFILRLSPAAKDHRLGKIVASVVIIWTLVALLGTAFQCGVPRGWDFWNGKCINMEAWHYFVCLSNMATEALILTQAFFLNHGIHASLKKRLLFAGIFLPRILIIVQLPLVHPASSSHDPSYDICDISVVEEVVQCLSIVTACWGQLKPFLTWLKLEGRLEVITNENTYNLQDSKSQFRSRERKTSTPDYGIAREPLVVSVTRDWEVDSQSSQTHIIQENQHPWMGEGSGPTIEGGR